MSLYYIASLDYIVLCILKQDLPLPIGTCIIPQSRWRELYDGDKEGWHLEYRCRKWRVERAVQNAPIYTIYQVCLYRLAFYPLIIEHHKPQDIMDNHTNLLPIGMKSIQNWYNADMTCFPPLAISSNHYPHYTITTAGDAITLLSNQRHHPSNGAQTYHHHPSKKSLLRTHFPQVPPQRHPH